MPAQANNQTDLPVSPEDELQSGCCRISPLIVNRWTLGLLLAVAVLSTATAAYLLGQKSQAAAGPNVYFPPIDATAAVTSEKFSMATGLISDRAEGLFVLDHNSGLLQCSVLYPRKKRFMGLFTANVGIDLNSGGKGGRYMMTTGLADFLSSNAAPAASSVIYVLDTATGVYACYGVPFNNPMMNSGKPQQGRLVLIHTGTANPIINRDDLR